MKIGSFGNIIFDVSNKKSLFITKISSESSVNFQTHNTIGSKAKKEYVNAGLRSVSLQLYISAKYGYSPRKTIDKLINKCENGEAEFLIIGGKPLSMNKFVIDSVPVEWGNVYKNGKLESANVSLSLSEYV